MKIDPANGLSGTPSPPVNRPEETQGGDFKSILEEKMESPSVEENDGTRPPSAVETIPDIAFPSVSPAGDDDLVQQMEDFLDTLENYQQKLMDPDTSLKELSPLVVQIQSEGEKLTDALQGLQAGDGMQDILSQMLITSSLEVIRFNRGDYIA